MEFEMNITKEIKNLEDAIRACKDIELIQEEMQKIKSSGRDVFLDCHIQDAIYIGEDDKYTLLCRCESLIFKRELVIFNAIGVRMFRDTKRTIEVLDELIDKYHALRFYGLIMDRFNSGDFEMPDGFWSEGKTYIYSADTKQQMIDRCNDLLVKFRASIDGTIEGLK
jgi:hypothetical protein